MACVDRSNITCKANMKKILPLEDMDNLEGVDRISELPEDIMSTLLFQLEMKEAAKTSILSKRWRYIWTNWSDLDFDYLKIIPECEVYQYPKPIEEIKYINWVNQVINLHRGQSIEKFRVRFGIHESQVHHIDRWVKFALAKKVKKLELELPLYDCPVDLAYNLKPSLFESGIIRRLTCLSLINVNVSGELLEFVLTECHHLEQLFVEFSWTLVSLKVASSKLKRLSILNCDALKKLEIDAVNLSYLDYYGDPIIEFKSLPLSLSEAAFRGECCSASIPICQQIACFAMQLSKLSLRFMINPPGQCITCNIPAKSLPCFSNLKCLELRNWCISRVDLPSIIRLLGACPVLSEFKMQFCWFLSSSIPKEARVLQGLEPLSLMNSRKRHNYIYDHSLEDDVIEYKALPCLRVFQFEGFVGGDDDLNLILTIFNISVQLHSFICHPLRPSKWETILADEVRHEARSRATKLGSFIPPKVNYVISDTYNTLDYF